MAELRLPPVVPAHVLRLLDTRLWIGPPGCGAPLHRDLQDNFLLQLFGRKAVTLVPPHHAQALGVTPVSPFLHTTAVPAGVAPPPETSPVTVVLKPGEMLYIPAGWFHATDTRAAALAVQAEQSPEIEPPARPATARPAAAADLLGSSGLSGSVNFFMSACFAAVGVIVPELQPPDWFGPPPPLMVAAAAGPS